MRRLLPLLLVSLLSTQARAEDWVAYGERDDVASYSKALPNSKVCAMRGVATLNVPIGKLLGVFLDTKRATKWVNLLIQLDERRISGTNDAVERHIFDMPWPVSDREFVFKRTVAIDAATKTVTVRYKSIEDGRFPVTADYVRATDHGSSWSFTALPGGKTRVEAIAMVDPEGSLPAWLFNSVQRSWPRESIHGLLAESAKPDVVPFATVAGW